MGHRAPSVRAHYMAAVRACGDGSLLSGLAATYLLRSLKEWPRLPEVTTPTERRVHGIRTRRSPQITRLDAATHAGIPITSVSRTLVDLAARLEIDDLAAAVHQAVVLHNTKPGQVEAVLPRHPNTPGGDKLRSVLRGDARVTLSKLERRVDCRWPEAKLTVELDGYRYHHTRHA